MPKLSGSCLGWLGNVGGLWKGERLKTAILVKSIKTFFGEDETGEIGGGFGWL